MELRQVIKALQSEGYARKFRVPPDNLGNKDLRMPCLNLECPERASVNFAATNRYRQGLYNCPHCELRGDAIDLIIALAGEGLDPYGEVDDKEAVALAHIWAETYAGAQPESPEDRPAYVPSWLRE